MNCLFLVFFLFLTVDQSKGQGHLWEAWLSDVKGRELQPYERVHQIPQNGSLHPLPRWVLIKVMTIFSHIVIYRLLFFWPCLICTFFSVQQRAYQYTSPVQEWLRNMSCPVLGINAVKKMTFVKLFHGVLGFLLMLKYSVFAIEIPLRNPWT